MGAGRAQEAGTGIGMDRTYTDHPAGQVCCGRCGQPIAVRGQGEGFDYLATYDEDGLAGAVEADHVAWWDTNRDLRHHIHLDTPH
jgi:hypothetical protein